MKKRILYLFIAFALFLTSNSIVISATSNVAEVEVNRNIKILDDKSFIDLQTNTTYVFNSKSEMDDFLRSIPFTPDVGTRATCFPGDVGYSNCNGNPVVHVTNTVFSSTLTGWILSSNYLRGNAGWLTGLGRVGINGAVSASYTFNGKSIGIVVTQTTSFQVPAGKRGNIKYERRFIEKVIQPYDTYKVGSKKAAASYKTCTFGQGSFVRVLQ